MEGACSTQRLDCIQTGIRHHSVVYVYVSFYVYDMYIGEFHSIWHSSFLYIRVYVCILFSYHITNHYHMHLSHIIPGADSPLSPVSRNPKIEPKLEIWAGTRNSSRNPILYTLYGYVIYMYIWICTILCNYVL